MTSPALRDAPPPRTEAQALAERMALAVELLRRKGVIGDDAASELVARLAPYLGEPQR